MRAVYSGEVRVELGTRSGMCCVGWVVWVQGFIHVGTFTFPTHLTFIPS